MAELTPFGYHAGDSFLHQLDSRFKLLFLALISMSGMGAGITGLSLTTLALLLLIIRIRLPVSSGLKEMRCFLMLLFFVFMARACFTPGTPLATIRCFETTCFLVTREGVHDGIIVCWRLLLVVLLGLLLVSSTRPSEIRAAVVWLLRPVPFIPEKRVGTMMGLVMRFVPVILGQARETADAQRARGIENRKNPVYRLTRLAIPLMRRTFEDADELVGAMEARCYSENRTGPELSSGPKEWIALVAVLSLCLLMHI